eukprot:gene18617-26322_t
MDSPEDYKLDMYTELSEMSSFKAVGLTDGLIPTDNTYYFKKQTRDFRFPVDRIYKASEFDFRNAQATALIDAKHIKNAITGKSIDDIPDDDHPNYIRLNNILRGRFVAPLWSRLLKAGYEMEQFYPILKNSEIKKLDSLAFERLPEFNDEVAARFVENFPVRVECIDINLREGSLQEAGMRSIFKLPRIVEKVREFSITGATHYSEAISELCETLKAQSATSCRELLTIRICDCSLT